MEPPKSMTEFMVDVTNMCVDVATDIGDTHEHMVKKVTNIKETLSSGDCKSLSAFCEMEGVDYKVPKAL
eukprot:10427100-Heterocapsa_arctica.AAC.1